MTPEAQRIAIAEACGWTLCQPRASMFSVPWISGMNPHPDKIEEIIPCDGSPPRKANDSDYAFETLPDYLHDLNAMHKAEITLEDDPALDGEYWETLYEINDGGYDQEPIDGPPNGHWCDLRKVGRSTAAQRAEAFLRTIGKWEE